jgi:hypothetical protein
MNLGGDAVSGISGSVSSKVAVLHISCLERSINVRNELRLARALGWQYVGVYQIQSIVLAGAMISVGDSMQ